MDMVLGSEEEEIKTLEDGDDFLVNFGVYKNVKWFG